MGAAAGLMREVKGERVLFVVASRVVVSPDEGGDDYQRIDDASNVVEYYG